MPFCFEFCNAAFQRKRKYFIASLVFCCALFPWRVFASEAPITIGFPLVSHPWSASRFLEQSLNYLNWKIPTYSFQAKWISVDDIEKAFDEGKLDLAVFPSGYLIDEKTRSASSADDNGFKRSARSGMPVPPVPSLLREVVRLSH